MNVVVLSWIMNYVRKDLLSSIIYVSNAHKVWLDLKKRFDTVNRSRVFYLHREIVTFTQGTLSVSEYFSRLCHVQVVIALSHAITLIIMITKDFYCF